MIPRIRSDPSAERGRRFGTKSRHMGEWEGGVEESGWVLESDLTFSSMYDVHRKNRGKRGHALNLRWDQKPSFFKEPYPSCLDDCLQKLLSSTENDPSSSVTNVPPGSIAVFTKTALAKARETIKSYSTRSWRVWIPDDVWGRFSMCKILCSPEEGVTSVEFAQMLLDLGRRGEGCLKDAVEEGDVVVVGEKAADVSNGMGMSSPSSEGTLSPPTTSTPLYSQESAQQEPTPPPFEPTFWELADYLNVNNMSPPNTVLDTTTSTPASTSINPHDLNFDYPAPSNPIHMQSPISPSDDLISLLFSNNTGFGDGTLANASNPLDLKVSVNIDEALALLLDTVPASDSTLFAPLDLSFPAGVAPVPAPAAPPVPAMPGAGLLLFAPLQMDTLAPAPAMASNAYAPVAPPGAPASVPPPKPVPQAISPYAPPMQMQRALPVFYGAQQHQQQATPAYGGVVSFRAVGLEAATVRERSVSPAEPPVPVAAPLSAIATPMARSARSVTATEDQQVLGTKRSKKSFRLSASAGESVEWFRGLFGSKATSSDGDGVPEDEHTQDALSLPASPPQTRSVHHNKEKDEGSAEEDSSLSSVSKKLGASVARMQKRASMSVTAVGAKMQALLRSESHSEVDSELQQEGSRSVSRSVSSTSLEGDAGEGEKSKMKVWRKSRGVPMEETLKSGEDYVLLDEEGEEEKVEKKSAEADEGEATEATKTVLSEKELQMLVALKKWLAGGEPKDVVVALKETPSNRSKTLLLWALIKPFVLLSNVPATGHSANNITQAGAHAGETEQSSAKANEGKRKKDLGAALDRFADRTVVLLRALVKKEGAIHVGDLAKVLVAHIVASSPLTDEKDPSDEPEANPSTSDTKPSNSETESTPTEKENGGHSPLPLGDVPFGLALLIRKLVKGGVVE
ncbi:hypothetical protein HK102_006347, partial [Quaeritorhiza haematococci]